MKRLIAIALVGLFMLTGIGSANASAPEDIGKAVGSAATSFLSELNTKLGGDQPQGLRGPFCNATGICGNFLVAGSVGFGAIPNWGPDNQNGYGGGWYQAVVQPGQNSSMYYQDTDGFYCGAGYHAVIYMKVRGLWTPNRTVRGPINVKIRDTESIRIQAFPN